MELTNKRRRLYLICGKAEQGKSEVSAFIKKIYQAKGEQAVILDHVKYLKDYVKDYFGWDGRNETKPRALMQQLGTELIRQKLNKPYFFINRLKEDIEILSYFFDIIIIDNIRLKIEIYSQQASFEDTISIKVTRPNFKGKLSAKQKQHLTEIDLDDYQRFDYTIINDQTIAELKNKVMNLINEIEGSNFKKKN